jgi:hypothetical protein
MDEEFLLYNATLLLGRGRVSSMFLSGKCPTVSAGASGHSLAEHRGETLPGPTALSKIVEHAGGVGAEVRARQRVFARGRARDPGGRWRRRRSAHVGGTPLPPFSFDEGLSPPSYVL